MCNAVGAKGRKAACPQYCDACFTGDYPTTLTDYSERENQAENTLPIKVA